MKKFMSFSTAGSADYNNSLIKNLIKENDSNIKVDCITGYLRHLHCRYMVSTSYTDKKDLDKLYDKVKGIASHAVFEEESLDYYLSKSRDLWKRQN